MDENYDSEELPTESESIIRSFISRELNDREYKLLVHTVRRSILSYKIVNDLSSYEKWDVAQELKKLNALHRKIEESHHSILNLSTTSFNQLNRLYLDRLPLEYEGYWYLENPIINSLSTLSLSIKTYTNYLELIKSKGNVKTLAIQSCIQELANGFNEALPDYKISYSENSVFYKIVDFTINELLSLKSGTKDQIKNYKLSPSTYKYGIST